jgi:hypothetical protein
MLLKAVMAKQYNDKLSMEKEDFTVPIALRDKYAEDAAIGAFVSLV